MWDTNVDESMQELRFNHKELSRIIYQREKQIQFLETKALNLSMFYVASQLAIFLSNSKSTCKKAWKPLFFLSLSIAVAFVLNFGTTIVVYVRTRYEQDRNYVDREENFHQMSKLQRRGAGSSGVRVRYEIKLDTEKDRHGTRLDMFVMYQRYAHIGLTAGALLAITALVLHACRSSVCPLPL